MADGDGSGAPAPRTVPPPSATNAARAAVFDTIAELYDAARPRYPAGALAGLVERAALGPGSRVLEVGCGTGQLTRDLAPTGVVVDALEPGAALAAIARRHLAPYRDVTVTETTFESFAGVPRSYDAVVSATAFHWVDPRISFTKAASLLRPGGTLALLTHIHAAGGTHASEPAGARIRAAHEELVPQIGSWWFPTADEVTSLAQGDDIAALWSRIESKLVDPPPVGQLFTPSTVTTHPWLATYDRDGYLAMLSTQSSYALLSTDQRDQLLTAIGAVIDAHLGNTVTKEYVTVLATARTRLTESRP